MTLENWNAHAVRVGARSSIATNGWCHAARAAPRGPTSQAALAEQQPARIVREPGCALRRFWMYAVIPAQPINRLTGWRRDCAKAERWPTSFQVRAAPVHFCWAAWPRRTTSLCRNWPPNWLARPYPDCSPPRCRWLFRNGYSFKKKLLAAV